MWGALSDERTGLPFTIAEVAAPRYIASAWTAQKTPLPTVLQLLHRMAIARTA
jgi:hypothetical protein